jgi:hypothetical protein
MTPRSLRHLKEEDIKNGGEKAALHVGLINTEAGSEASR